LAVTWYLKKTLFHHYKGYRQMFYVCIIKYLKERLTLQSKLIDIGSMIGKPTRKWTPFAKMKWCEALKWFECNQILGLG
jgi:hypothetical protein